MQTLLFFTQFTQHVELLKRGPRTMGEPCQTNGRRTDKLICRGYFVPKNLFLHTSTFVRLRRICLRLNGFTYQDGLPRTGQLTELTAVTGRRSQRGQLTDRRRSRSEQPTSAAAMACSLSPAAGLEHSKMLFIQLFEVSITSLKLSMQQSFVYRHSAL